jgi:hypothetical protein
MIITCCCRQGVKGFPHFPDFEERGEQFIQPAVIKMPLGVEKCLWSTHKKGRGTGLRSAYTH